MKNALCLKASGGLSPRSYFIAVLFSNQIKKSGQHEINLNLDISCSVIRFMLQ